jgi:hypothetical protein
MYSRLAWLISATRPIAGPIVFLLATCGVSRLGHGDERLEGIACRSVHLGYPCDEGDIFYCEVTVQQTAPGTYFMVAGFRMGYFGLQELADHSKVILFSVWEPGEQNNPNTTPEDRRVETLSIGPGVRSRRFGGEGTGGQSFYDYDWKVGETYRFAVFSKAIGERTAYMGYFYVPEESRWQPMAAFSTLAGGKQITGCYSFVEDFRRNRISATQARRAAFSNPWVRSLDGRWQDIDRARFTADANPVLNIDAGAEAGRFFLATGGETRNDHAPLRSMIELVDPQLDDRTREDAESRLPPDDLPQPSF